jgi:hypothetical protein
MAPSKRPEWRPFSAPLTISSQHLKISYAEGTNLYRLWAMGGEEDKETIFQEAARTAWVRVFIREASKRGYPIENIVALLDEPGLTVEEAIERILSTRGPKPN